MVLAAAKQAGRTGSLTELEREITVAAETPRTLRGTIKLSGTGATPDQSAAFTNAFADQLGAYMSSLVAQRNQGQLAAAKQKVTDLQSEIAALGKTKASTGLQNQLNVALAQEQALSAASSSTGYLILQPAQASSAKTGGGGLSGLGSSRLVRGFAGLLIGLVLAAGIVLVLEMLDKRIRGARGGGDVRLSRGGRDPNPVERERRGRGIGLQRGQHPNGGGLSDVENVRAVWCRGTSLPIRGRRKWPPQSWEEWSRSCLRYPNEQRRRVRFRVQSLSLRGTPGHHGGFSRHRSDPPAGGHQSCRNLCRRRAAGAGDEHPRSSRQQSRKPSGRGPDGTDCSRSP